jgi:FtsP/CotA-like multicopper oxidase with cupredoxin domain
LFLKTQISYNFLILLKKYKLFIRNSIYHIFLVILFPFSLSAQVKRHLVIGRTTGDITINDRSIRMFGFAEKLKDKPTLPGVVIDAVVGDSVEIDFWNVSQGDPHDIRINNIETRVNNQRLADEADGPIRHMEHGYYSFEANTPGTFVYYSGVNYPFDLQGGMFGVIIIRPKNDSNASRTTNERLWCGSEIDTTWHTDEIMDAERGEKNMLEPKPDYRPQYFIINGKTQQALLDSSIALQGKKDSIIHLRIANAGMMEQIVTFPEPLTWHMLAADKADAPVKTQSSITLQPLQTCEVFITAHVACKDFVTYAFKKDPTGGIVNTQKIPVSFTEN